FLHEVVSMAEHLDKVENGVLKNMESTVKRLKLSVEVLIEVADFLRKRIVVKLLETPDPTQGISFLAAAVQLQLKLRSWGIQREVFTQIPFK
ncbi:Hypothetical predicted protein, partial [Olea europaea subsp. europaea]